MATRHTIKCSISKVRDVAVYAMAITLGFSSLATAGLNVSKADVEVAKKILSRIDKYIEFDRVISEKDYAQGSELVANRRTAMDFEFQAGISAAGRRG